jgi:hypothetical protein
MTDDTTQPGVSDESVSSAAPTAGDAQDADGQSTTMTEHRLSQLDQIAERAAVNMDRELREQGEEGVAFDEDTDPADAVAAAARAELAEATRTDHAAPIAAAAPTPAAANIDMNARVRVKIDGIEEERTLEQLVREAQKSGAADRRLAEATALLRQAQAQATSPRSETPTTMPPSSGSSPPPQEAVRAKAKDVLGAVFSGDEDAAATKLAELIAQAPTPAPALDVEQVAAAVMRKSTEDAALRAFFGEYRAIAADASLQAMADEELALVQRRYPDLPFDQQLQRAGQRVYIDRGLPLPQAQRTASSEAAAATTNRQRQLAGRKAQLDTPVARTGSSATVASAMPESSEDERRSIVAEMAARRQGLVQQPKR